MGRLLVAPGVAPGNANVFGAAKRAAKQLDFDVAVISWFRPGAIVAGTKTPSKHAIGAALDMRSTRAREIADNSPCGGSSLDEQGMQDGDKIAAAMSAAGFETVIWKSCDGGNHYNHVHADNGGVPMPGSGSTSVPAPGARLGVPGDPGAYKGLSAEGLPVIGPIVQTYNSIDDVISFLYQERGLIRIAEVLLGFGALALGIVALIVDSSIKNNAVKALNPAAAVIGTLAATRSDREPTVAPKPDKDVTGFPENAVIKGSGRPRRSKATESTRRRKASTAARKSAMAGRH